MIRSYRQDFGWLQYALKFIQKHAKNFDSVELVIPRGDRIALPPLPFHCGIHEVQDAGRNGYMEQQINKLYADRYCGNGFVLFLDSDAMLLHDITPETFQDPEGRPKIYVTNYSLVGDAQCWKGITEKAIRQEVTLEYMRRLPMMYHAHTLRNLQEWFMKNHGMQLMNYVHTQPGRHFSEFNLMGAYAYFHEHSQYHFMDTEQGLEPAVVEQFWSWGGLTNEIKERLEARLAA